MIYSNIFKKLIPYFIVMSVGYILSSLIYFILPHQGVNSKPTAPSTHLEYKRFNIQQLFQKNKVVSASIEVKKIEYQLLSNITLKAIYTITEEQGWIIIAGKSNKTFLLSIDDKFKGYKLVRLYKNYVIFDKAGVEYKLELLKSKKVNYSVTKVVQQKPSATNTKIVVVDDKISIHRTYINSYINNFDKIWNDIAINETKDKNGAINGFKVNFIRPNTAFYKLGLKKGDIIKTINNIELKSYNDAFTIYKKINKLTNLNIKILRNNKEMELNYEIK